MNSPANSFQSAEVLVSPSWACNLRCKYCFIETNHVIKQEPPMTVETGLKIIDALDEGLADMKDICVHFYGGEPFINPRAISAMVKHALAKKNGRFKFAVTTNGTQLSDEIVETLAAGKFHVVLSIDGPAEIHDGARRTAADAPCHADVMRFMETVLAKTPCHVCGSAVVRSGWRLIDAVHYLLSLPVHSIKAQIVRLPAGTPYSLTPQERQQYLKDLDAVGQIVIQELEQGKIPRDPRFAPKVLQILKGEERTSFCAAGLSNFGITPSGNIYPCLLIDQPDTHLGNISQPAQVWREAGKRWRDKNIRREKCLTCSSLPICGGGCPAIISVCGEDECDIIIKNCDVAKDIYNHFKDSPETLLALVGIL